MAREINPVWNFIFGSIHTCLPMDMVDVELTIRMVKDIYTYHKDHNMESTIFLPWSKTVFPFPSLRWKIQAYKNDTKHTTMTWNNGIMPQFSVWQKPSWNPRKCTSGKIRNRWSRHNHWFNPIKTNRYNTLDVNLTDMKKTNIIQPVPKELVNILWTHVHTACMKPHIPVLYLQIGQVRTQMVGKPKWENRGH